MNAYVAPLNFGATQAREQFISNVLAITGDTRLLWLPKSTETTTSLDESLTGRTLTYDATIAARLSPLGLGQAVSFNGSSQYATSPDTANLSFGNGTTDSPFSIVALANVTDTANARLILSKFSAATVGEWNFQIIAGDTLRFVLYDDSSDAAPFRTSDAAISQGAWALFGGTYSAATGGATAANDIALYQNGTLLASTATNAAGYVAMENLTDVLNLGMAFAVPASFFQGSMAFVALCQTNLSASDHWALKKLVNAYFGLSL